jgi:hypothetical protein
MHPEARRQARACCGTKVCAQLLVDEMVVEVLTTQVGVTSSGLHLEDTLLDGQKGHIKGSSSKIENEDVTLTDDFLVKTIGNGSSSGQIDSAVSLE